MKIVFLAWRDLANPLAGGSEILVDRLASGLVARGHDVTLIAGGPVEQRDYKTVDSGGVLSQYLKGPLIALRHHRDADVVVDVCNGLPFFSPLWRRKPTITLVNHVHTAQWELWFPPALAAIGRTIERDLMPRLYRRRLFMAVSPSTAGSLESIGIPSGNIRIVPNGVEIPLGTIASKSAEPLFFALGRLVPHKRYSLLLQTWDRVKEQTGGQLVIAGDGPEMDRLAAQAGSDVTLVGRVTESEKHDLLGRAWLFLHPAMLEGWGLVVLEAAAHGTPTLGFDAPGVRDSVLDGVSGSLAQDDDDLAREWVRLTMDPQARAQLAAGARARADQFSWTTTIDRFERLANEAAAPAGRRKAIPAAPRRAIPSPSKTSGTPTLSIVVPAYNEASRLMRSLPPLAERARREDIEIIVVDDGSTDGTADLARQLLAGAPRAQVVTLPRNTGKGAAVRRGVAEANGQSIAFMDADLATDLGDLLALENALSHAHVAIGSRAAQGSTTSGGRPTRVVMGRTFNRLARTVTRLNVRDFQCGFKAFRGPAAKLLFHLSEVDGYAFDVELLALASRIGYRTLEVPVRWEAVPGSHIRPVHHSMQMTRDVLTLSRRWTSTRLTAAVAAHSRREEDPRRLVASLDSLVGPLGPVIPWHSGAIALLPFKDAGDAEVLRDRLRHELPQLKLEVAELSAYELWEPAGRAIRIALAAS